MFCARRVVMLQGGLIPCWVPLKYIRIGLQLMIIVLVLTSFLFLQNLSFLKKPIFLLVRLLNILTLVNTYYCTLILLTSVNNTLSMTEQRRSVDINLRRLLPKCRNLFAPGYTVWSSCTPVECWVRIVLRGGRTEWCFLLKPFQKWWR
jgi:hypothetical protein